MVGEPQGRRGHNVFQGGFLGLDNIGVFDRSAELPVPGHLGQADGTAWMGFYSLTMLAMALELARDDPAYEDLATKFFEHFLHIAGALNGVDTDSAPLWDDDDAFFYDVLHLDSGEFIKLKVRSLVGLIPLLAVQTLEPELLEALPEFERRLGWFLPHRPALASLVPSWETPGMGSRRLLALVRGHRLKALLARLLDPDEFLSDHGIRSMSAVHHDRPFMLELGGASHRVGYEPAESRSGTFGGNSNWRGPVWWPINYLLLEALRSFDRYYGPEFRVPFPADRGARSRSARRRTRSRGGWNGCSSGTSTVAGRFAARTRPASPKAAPTTCCCSTSTSTGRRTWPRSEPPDGLDGAHRDAPRRTSEDGRELAEAGPREQHRELLAPDDDDPAARDIGACGTWYSGCRGRP